jgi:hypothetical protein
MLLSFGAEPSESETRPYENEFKSLRSEDLSYILAHLSQQAIREKRRQAAALQSAFAHDPG